MKALNLVRRVIAAATIGADMSPSVGRPDQRTAWFPHHRTN